MGPEPSCDHQWRYLVTLATRAVRARRCERCGLRALLPEARPPARQPEVARSA